MSSLPHSPSSEYPLLLLPLIAHGSARTYPHICSAHKHACPIIEFRSIFPAVWEAIDVLIVEHCLSIPISQLPRCHSPSPHSDSTSTSHVQSNTDSTRAIYLNFSLL